MSDIEFDTVESLTVEIVLIAKMLKEFNLFYYLGAGRCIDEPYHIIDLLDGLDKGKWKVARFNDWLLFKYNGKYCRLSLNKLNKFIEFLNIKER